MYEHASHYEKDSSASNKFYQQMLDDKVFMALFVRWDPDWEVTYGRRDTAAIYHIYLKGHEVGYQMALDTLSKNIQRV